MPSFEDYLTHYTEHLGRGEPFVNVTLVAAVGSTPQDAGSKMLVTAKGLAHGTVGGGRIEQKAIVFAQAMLTGGADSAPTALVEWNLQRDVGMTCGGVVTLYFEAVHHNTWQIAIFGAGHVANALVHILCKLDCRIVCIDPRKEWLDRLPHSSKLTACHQENMADYVSELPADAFVLCLTMGHRTDRPILERILSGDRHFPFLGAIGSRAKRSVLVRELVDSGVPADRAEEFHCPIGLDLGTNDPQEIAISIAAQLIEQRDR